MASKRNLDKSARTDRGSLVNPGSEDDEVLSDADEGATVPDGEADQSGTRGARGKPGPTIDVPTQRKVRE
jgi:hypothetical protein